MPKPRSLGPCAPKYCYTAWSFRGPAEKIDVRRILAELDEQEAVVAEVAVKEQVGLIIRSDILHELSAYEPYPGREDGAPPDGFYYSGGRIRRTMTRLSCPIPHWTVMKDTSAQALVEWIRLAQEKKNAGVRTVVRAYQP